MKNFFDYVRTELHVTVPEGNIPGSWFVENGISMVVRCSCCEMTMASPSAWIDEQGFAYCADCAGIEEE